MEPNKLENTFRNQLNNHEINPSANSWDRLDAMLAVAEKPKSHFKWYYFAASFIGFLLIGTIFFSQKRNVIINKRNNVAIETKKESSKTPVKTIKIEANNTDKMLKQEKQVLVQTQENVKIKEGIQVTKSQKEVIATISSKEKNNPIPGIEKSFQVNVDDLLASAENTSAVKIKKSVVKINPNALLNEVDSELELTFREKALHTLTKKYKEAKVALANRNNQ